MFLYHVHFSGRQSLINSPESTDKIRYTEILNKNLRLVYKNVIIALVGVLLTYNISNGICKTDALVKCNLQ